MQVLGRFGGEGRVPSLVSAAVEREVPMSYFFSFVFVVSSMGFRLKRERNEFCINPKGISPWVNFVGRQDKGGGRGLSIWVHS
jgi:hypothetical protein